MRVENKHNLEQNKMTQCEILRAFCEHNFTYKGKILVDTIFIDVLLLLASLFFFYYCFKETKLPFQWSIG